MSNDGTENFNQKLHDELRFKQFSQNQNQNIYQKPIPMIS